MKFSYLLILLTCLLPTVTATSNTTNDAIKLFDAFTNVHRTIHRHLSRSAQFQDLHNEYFLPLADCSTCDLVNSPQTCPLRTEHTGLLSALKRHDPIANHLGKIGVLLNASNIITPWLTGRIEFCDAQGFCTHQIDSSGITISDPARGFQLSPTKCRIVTRALRNEIPWIEDLQLSGLRFFKRQLDPLLAEEEKEHEAELKALCAPYAFEWTCGLFERKARTALAKRRAALDLVDAFISGKLTPLIRERDRCRLDERYAECSAERRAKWDAESRFCRAARVLDNLVLGCDKKRWASECRPPIYRRLGPEEKLQIWVPGVDGMEEVGRVAAVEMVIKRLLAIIDTLAETPERGLGGEGKTGLHVWTWLTSRLTDLGSCIISGLVWGVWS